MGGRDRHRFTPLFHNGLLSLVVPHMSRVSGRQLLGARTQSAQDAVLCTYPASLCTQSAVLGTYLVTCAHGSPSLGPISSTCAMAGRAQHSRPELEARRLTGHSGRLSEERPNVVGDRDLLQHTQIAQARRRGGRARRAIRLSCSSARAGRMCDDVRPMCSTTTPMRTMSPKAERRFEIGLDADGRHPDAARDDEPA